MLFSIQQAPANTVGYMIAGYAVIFSFILIYLVSLAIRRRNLKADLEVIQEMEKEKAQE